MTKINLPLPECDCTGTGNIFNLIMRMTIYNVFLCSQSSLTMTVTKPNAVVGDLAFQDIWVYGVSVAPTTVSATSNGQAQPAPTFQYYTDTKVSYVTIKPILSDR